jgi:hypothetical protein
MDVKLLHGLHNAQSLLQIISHLVMLLTDDDQLTFIIKTIQNTCLSFLRK